MLARSTSRAEPRPSSVKSRGRSWSNSIIPREDSSLARCVARLSCLISSQNSGIVSLAKVARQSAQADQTQHVWPCEVLLTCRKAKSLCGGYLVYLFSQRPLSRNEQHEQHAGSFPVRHQSHLQRGAEMLSSQAHVSTQSAIGKREDRLPAALALASDPVSEEECFTAPVPLQPEGLGACETGFPTAQAREKKLVTEDSKPVGSGESIYI